MRQFLVKSVLLMLSNAYFADYDKFCQICNGYESTAPKLLHTTITKWEPEMFPPGQSSDNWKGLAITMLYIGYALWIALIVHLLWEIASSSCKVVFGFTYVCSIGFWFCTLTFSPSVTQKKPNKLWYGKSAHLFSCSRCVWRSSQGQFVEIAPQGKAVSDMMRWHKLMCHFLCITWIHYNLLGWLMTRIHAWSGRKKLTNSLWIISLESY